MNETNSPYGHQKFLAGHLAKRALIKNGKEESTMTVARLETPEGKPVIVHGQEYPERGTRIDVSRGSHAAGNLVIDQTVSIDVLPGANLRELNKPQNPEQAQEIINDLRRAS